MSEYYLVKTNRDGRILPKELMLSEHCVSAYHNAMDRIDRIQAGDIVFIYENRTGAIAVGTATGIVEPCDLDGPGNGKRMSLTDFDMIEPPIPASMITETSQRVADENVCYRPTVYPLNSKAGAEIHKIAQKRIGK